MVGAGRRVHSRNAAGGPGVNEGWLTLSAERSSPAAARRWTESTLEGRVHQLSDVLLCVSELVTNAVIHAATTCELTWHLAEGRLRVTVRDFAPGRWPVRREFDRSATTGRGLQFLDRLTDRWGVDQDERSKSVWFEVDIDLPPELRG